MGIRRLAMEGLENRTMLAGNVNVFVEGGTLFIVGNDAGNGVSVHQVDTGRYVVTGFALAGSATTLNGSGSVRIVTGVTNDINVDLNAGNDVFCMSQSAARRQACADELSGFTAGPIAPSPEAPNPNTTTSQTRVPRNLIVNADAGNDGVGVHARIGSDDLKGFDFGGIGHIITDGGADSVIVERTTAFDDLLIETGDADDFVRTFRVRTWDFFFASLGNGHDTMNATDYHGFHSHLIGGIGDDTIRVRDFHAEQEVFLFGEAGDDLITGHGVTGIELQIITADGRDRVQLRNSHVGDLHIDTGLNNDNVTLDSVTVIDELTVFLGNGNDRFNISNTSADSAYIDGGFGNDTFDNNGGNNLNNATVVNFENFI